MRQITALDTAVFKDFDAVHACLPVPAAGGRKCDVFTADAAPACDPAVDAIRYESVRDPEHGAAVAVLQPSCFKPHQPLEQHTWFLTVRRSAVFWQREGRTFEFDAGNWRR